MGGNEQWRWRTAGLEGGRGSITSSAGAVESTWASKEIAKMDKSMEKDGEEAKGVHPSCVKKTFNDP